jgi:hypothetical protein
MAEKLGQELLRRKLISRRQLEDALKSQAIFGGRLGSHLIDAGALEEEPLARLLSQRHKVPFIKAKHVARLTPELISLLPVDLAKKYLAIPIQKDRTRLVIALPDPEDLAGIDDISFRTGLIIRPVVAAESTIVRALQRYYGVDRVGDYILMPAEESLPEPEKTPIIEEDLSPESWLGGFEQDAMLESWDAKQRAEEQRADARISPQVAEPAPTPSKQLPVVENLDQLGELFSKVDNREEIADLAMAFFAQEYRSGALFMVRHNTAFGWRAVRNGKHLSGFENFQDSLDEPSVLQTVSLSRHHYLGPMPRTPFNSLLLQELGGQIPEQVLVIPIILLDRLIGFLYLDNPKLHLAALIPETQELAGKLTMAFEMLILKNKLASM